MDYYRPDNYSLFSSYVESADFDEGMRQVHSIYQRFENERVINVPTCAELEFLHPISKDVSLYGFIDLIIAAPKGNKVYDFKTGKKKNFQADVDKSEQLTIYWGYLNSKEIPIESCNIYDTKYDNVISTMRTKEQFEIVKNDVFGVIEQVKDKAFTATPSRDVCRWCTYCNLCEYSKSKD